jgi:uncharacterized protein YbcC (UPF0753/DUF2309 family)
MNQSVSIRALGEESLDDAIEAACNAIAPNWPLDRFIAVNPWWGWIDRPFDQAGRAMARLAGTRFWMSPSYYRRAWSSGSIRRHHLRRAIEESGSALSDSALLAALHRRDDTPAPVPLLSDVHDEVRDLRCRPSWREMITHQISQFCAAWFDQDQADWHPSRVNGLYLGWRDAIAGDRAVSLLMRSFDVPERARSLPCDPRAAIALATRRHGLTGSDLVEWLRALLLRINGWAGWCAHLRWEARLEQRDDHHLLELLAIRASWESLLDDGRRGPDSIWMRWRDSWCRCKRAHAAAPPALLALWQRAEEIACQEAMITALASVRPMQNPGLAQLQAVFCIDARAEVFRRAIEQACPAVRTIGVAGFFGLPARYTPIGTTMSQPQLPVFLAPSITVTESCGSSDEDERLSQKRKRRLARRRPWREFARLPACGFTLVESLGVGYLAKIIARNLRSTGPAVPYPLHRKGLSKSELKRLRPRLVISDPADVGLRSRVAEQFLRTAGLTANLARLVVLVGHCSQTSNNPHAAGLNCGACAGQTGEVNARAVASLLNAPEVRKDLRRSGIHIPITTYFLAAAHNTTTDEVELFDTHEVPVSHLTDVARLRRTLSCAGQAARAERARSLGLERLMTRPRALLAAVRARASDWRQTRPEWGLANNAAFVIAPRERTRHLNLQGRAFLHDYDWRADGDGVLLDSIMNGPVLVAHWINMQYFASAVDNLRFGSGNKVLHNVVGGRIGVFEGNNGDLRIGLPMQSLHDGQRWMHAPVRLSVFVEAPRRMIESVVAGREVVRRLVENAWIYLFRFCDDGVERLRRNEWLRETCSAESDMCSSSSLHQGNAR